MRYVSFLFLLIFVSLISPVLARDKITVEADHVRVLTKIKKTEWSGTVVLSSARFLVRSDRLIVEEKTPEEKIFSAMADKGKRVSFSHLDPDTTEEWFGKAEFVQVNSVQKEVLFRGNAHLKQWRSGEVVQELVADQIRFNQNTGEVLLEGAKEGDKRRVLLTTMADTLQKEGIKNDAGNEVPKTAVRGLTTKRLREEF